MQNLVAPVDNSLKSAMHVNFIKCFKSRKADVNSSKKACSLEAMIVNGKSSRSKPFLTALSTADLPDKILRKLEDSTLS